MVISRLTTKNRRPKQNIGNREFDTDVLSYDTPGVAVNYQSNGKEKSYTPDFQVVRYQKKQIIEVLYARESFSIGEYRDCWEIARSLVPASLAEIGEALDKHKIRRNVLFKLLFHNLAEIDIQQPITANSTISAVAPKIDWRILFNG